MTYCLSMSKKPKKKSIAYLRKKADRLFQEIVRKVYRDCEVCGEPLSCGHHFISKGSSSYLRYSWENIIPICNSCHCKIEMRKSHELTGVIVLKRGQAWLDSLRTKQRMFIKTDRAYYETLIKNLEAILSDNKLTPYKTL